jgi:hypothetical protein
MTPSRNAESSIEFSFGSSVKKIFLGGIIYFFYQGFAEWDEIYENLCLVLKIDAKPIKFMLEG